MPWPSRSRCSGAARLEAQQYFGQNQVQYKHFKWRVLETEHFLVHYYPEEKEAAIDAARMAERSYARLSRIIGHQFREKKPIILFASRADFGQNNVTGDLGEGTGGVTEGLRHRSSCRSPAIWEASSTCSRTRWCTSSSTTSSRAAEAGAELADARARSIRRSGSWRGWRSISSIGPIHPLTACVAARRGGERQLPTIEQMTERPDKYFPYRYGESLWQYVGERWGDEAIGEIIRQLRHASASSAPSSASSASRWRSSSDDVARGGAAQVPAAARRSSIGRAISRSRCSPQDVRRTRSSSRPRSPATASTSRSSPTVMKRAARCSSTSGSPTRGPASASSAS